MFRVIFLAARMPYSSLDEGATQRVGLLRWGMGNVGSISEMISKLESKVTFSNLVRNHGDYQSADKSLL